MRMETVNALIESADIEICCGVLMLTIGLNYGKIFQMYTGNSLYLPEDFKHHDKKSIAGHRIYRMMKVAGVQKFSQLVGKAVRVQTTPTEIRNIGHIIDDFWLHDFAKHNGSILED